MKLSEVNGSRGAPMGRRDTHADDCHAPIKLIVHHLPFVDGDYDAGGAYWGAGEPLWRALEPEGEVEFFFRAKDRWDALNYVKGEYPFAEIVETPREMWFEDFVQGYEEAALWSSTDTIFDKETGGEKNVELDEYELAHRTRAEFREECAAFCNLAATQLEAALAVNGYTAERAGQDFWLTRNRHGVGYRDRSELPEDVRDALTVMSQAQGECDLYLGDNDLVYQQ